MATRRIITVNDYSTHPNDPNDWVSVNPGETKLELVVVSHYHFYRTGMESAGFNGPAGADEEQAQWLPEGDNAEGSKLVILNQTMLDEVAFACDIDCSQTKRGDNFILYFRTWSKPTIDWRWPKSPVSGRPRDFQIHIHIGESIQEYVAALLGD